MTDWNDLKSQLRFSRWDRLKIWWRARLLVRQSRRRRLSR